MNQNNYSNPNMQNQTRHSVSGNDRIGTNLRPAGNSPATGNGFTVPSGIGYDAYQGSIQQILRDNVGQYVDVEFLIGNNSLTTRSGILNNVGVSYIVLYDASNGRYMICDLYSIKFVTFYEPNN